MEIEIGYGMGTQKLVVPDGNLLGILTPNDIPCGLKGAEEVAYALANPIGTPRLRKIVKPGEKIAIITSDITRPMPTYTVMPLILDELYAAGVDKKDISLIFALGSHRKHTEEEKKKLAGERAFAEITCLDSDTSDCIRKGITKQGTPVDIMKEVAEADRRICLGNIEYHYFAGYSGGAKAIMPGVSTRDAIQSNHRLMVEETACAGRLIGNPVREDLEEAVAMVGVDFILNVVLDEHKKIIKAVAGDVTKAHREGCSFLDGLYASPIPQRADIVVVSQGGAPKDANLYQTQKALDNAKHAVKKGGIIVLVGSCLEGLGEHVFEEWMTEATKPRELIERVKRNFQLGGHKAAAIAMVLENAGIFLVSEMEPSFVQSIHLTPYKDVQTAFNDALKILGENASILIMPYGGSTLPKEGETV